MPDKINTLLLKGFKKLILKHQKRFKKIIIVTGGGATARRYRAAAAAVSNVTFDDQDWLGIHSTRLNGHLLRTIFRQQAHPVMVTNPYEKEPFNEKILIAAGWRPGWSTDYVAVSMAKFYGAAAVINLSNTDFVYDKDPNKFKDARPQAQISWPAFRKMVGNKWIPSGSYPFDPIASRLAHRLGLPVYCLNGEKLHNFDDFLKGESFRGTRLG